MLRKDFSKNYQQFSKNKLNLIFAAHVEDVLKNALIGVENIDN